MLLNVRLKMKDLLEQFNERAEFLLNSPLAKNVLLGSLKCSVSWKAGEGTEISSPDYEKNDLDAFILGLRLFVQDNEAISIKTNKLNASPVTMTPNKPVRFNKKAV